jgi:hypothetical protein
MQPSVASNRRPSMRGLAVIDATTSSARGIESISFCMAWAAAEYRGSLSSRPTALVIAGGVTSAPSSMCARVVCSAAAPLANWSAPGAARAGQAVGQRAE